jgi:hypothetical protein
MPMSMDLLYTFETSSGAKVTYAGVSAEHARMRAMSIYGEDLSTRPCVLARSCRCLVKRALVEQEAGHFVCRKCAGIIG